MKNVSKQMYELCKKHMHAYVLVETNDGMVYDGIITGLDDEFVTMAVPNDQNMPSTYPMREEDRQFGYPGYGFGYPGYGYGSSYGFPGYGFGYGYGPPRRFRRLVLPLAALTALALLPWY